jgi:acetate kinase
MDYVLACNAGSSSLKLTLFASTPAQTSRQTKAQSWAQVNTTNLSAGPQSSGSPSYVDMLFDWLAPLPAPDKILHRVVHSGLVTEQARILDDEAIALIRHWLPIAPRHNALALEMIESLRLRMPQLPQFAVYDSGLYANLPANSSRYALPDELSPGWPLRRYGFHGLAHRNQWRQVQALQQKAGRAADRVISLHLGSGASVTAWRDGRAIDTSMGFSPLEGLIMARRSGSLDPGILMHLLLREGFDAPALDLMLQQQSGLAALAGHDGDMRLIMQDRQQLGSAAAAAAIDQYCYQIRKTIGAYMAALGGVDAISFGGGVAEHQATLRQQIIDGLQSFGIVADSQANNVLTEAGSFHTTDSTCALYLTPVNEMDEMLRQYEAFALNK